MNIVCGICGYTGREMMTIDCGYDHYDTVHKECYDNLSVRLEENHDAQAALLEQTELYNMIQDIRPILESIRDKAVVYKKWDDVIKLRRILEL